MMLRLPLRICWLLLALAVMVAPCAADQLPAIGDQTVREMISRAIGNGLDQRPIWRALLHARPQLSASGYKSQVDSPEFFLSPKGRRDPREELRATILSFLQSPERGDQDPRCRFPARYRWLVTELPEIASRHDAPDCVAFREWSQLIAAKEIQLVFPSGYLNNPASSFGHTLLRLDSDAVTEQTGLLSYGANFAASTNETSGLTFAVRGIFGGYDGGFTVEPYYLRVRKYSDIENRDIWEYQLNFTEDEIRRVVEHLWEMRQAAFDYYFFDENCSYHLLGLLEVARPSLKLLDDFPVSAIPIDTVRSVVRSPGLLGEVHYRPSRRRAIAAMAAGLSAAERVLARELGQDKRSVEDAALQTLPAETRARVLELAYEYALYRLGKADAAEDTHLHALMRARSVIPVVSPAVDVPRPTTRPDQGHESVRVAVGAGLLDGRAFSEVRYRPAYHDIMASDAGYEPGTELRFLETTLRQFEGDSVELESFTAVGLRSYTPLTQFSRPWSWKLSTGVRRVRSAPRESLVVPHGNLGFGVSLQPFERILVYALGEGGLELKPAYEDNYSLGAGADMGLMYDFTQTLRLHLETRLLRFALGEEQTQFQGGAELRVRLAKDFDLRIGLQREAELSYWRTSGLVSLSVYF